MKGFSKSSIQDSYSEAFKIDLVNNKKEALLVNILALVVMLALMIPVYKSFFDFGAESARNGLGATLAARGPKLILAVVLFLLYIPAHEAVHGIVMRFFTTEKLRFGYNFLYAYAGSLEGVFNPIEYCLVALAPLVCFQLVFDLLMEIIPSFKAVWLFLIAINASGSMGDVYVFCRIAPRWKEKFLINDTGTDMTVYKENEKKS
ncbi:MAG: DUF3267 domain-containing protein [Spirochaetales bacterium]|nr:DUF3267 domain-containing protein [Candidatus Physcosoma equi]